MPLHRQRSGKPQERQKYDDPSECARGQQMRARQSEQRAGGQRLNNPREGPVDERLRAGPAQGGDGQISELGRQAID